MSGVLEKSSVPGVVLRQIDYAPFCATECPDTDRDAVIQNGFSFAEQILGATGLCHSIIDRDNPDDTAQIELTGICIFGPEKGICQLLMKASINLKHNRQ
ncbi:MAG TPA: hypothetical protein VLG47_03180 [Candidatus Saccharimonadales bacterium]|nr:hypothetical protein [Candidatus Saccharimonadales bacterium]